MLESIGPSVQGNEWGGMEEGTYLDVNICIADFWWKPGGGRIELRCLGLD